MIPFQYVEFYDVPRTIAVRYRGKLFLLQSAFDQERDEYPNDYTVYVLSESAVPQLTNGSWKFLEEQPMIPLGRVPVNGVRFDSSNRRELDPSVLDRFVNDLAV